MKYIIFVFCILSVNAWAQGRSLTDYAYGYVVRQLAADWSNSCVMGDESAGCWGQGQLGVRGLSQPRQMAVSSNRLCVLDDNGVSCWSNGHYPKKDESTPQLSNPYEIAMGAAYGSTLRFVCALDDDGVKCWARWDRTEADLLTNLPKLSNPRQIAAGWNHACAIDDNGVHCWKIEWDNYTRKTDVVIETDVPAFSHPTQIVVGREHICALDDDGVHCWGENDHGQIDVPPLYMPTQIAASEDYTCAIDDNGVHCWGWMPNKVDIPQFCNPSQITVGGDHACVLDEGGVSCWRFNDLDQYAVPSGLKYPYPSIQPRPIEVDLNSIFTKLTPARSKYVSEFLKPKFSPSRKDTTLGDVRRYFLNSVISNAVVSMDSEQFQNAVIPDWQNVMAKWESELRYTDAEDGLKKTPDTEFTRTVALTSIQSALNVALEFLPASEQTGVQATLRATGQAMSDVNDSAKIKSALQKLDTLTDEKLKLKSSSKSAFLVDSFELAARWLAEKVK